MIPSKLRRALPSVALPLAGLLSLATLASAQDARVVSCNSANGQILDIDFDAGTATTLVADNSRVSMQSCLFRNDGTGGLHLVVADRNGEVVFYPNGAGPGQIVLGIGGGNPDHPNGLSQDPQQNLYGVTSSTGGSSGAVAKVWMLRRSANGPLAGGYRGPVAYIDATLPGVQGLSETVLVTSNLGTLVAGDLLVLANDPPMVMRYHAADLDAFRAVLAAGGTPAELVPETFIHPPGAAVPAARRFPAGATPNGMDLTQEGSLLVSAGEGTILHYLADGTRKTDTNGAFVDFYTGLGNGQFKVATGQQNGALRAFVTDRNRGEIHRFGFLANGRGVLQATVADPQSPDGVATTTAGVQPTPSGSSVIVRSSNLIVSTIENVPQAGITAIEEFVFTDPRESEPGAPSSPSVPLHRALDLHDEISSLLPAGVTIPAHVRAFRKADPVTGLPTGAPTFVLFVVGSSAEILGTIQHIADEAPILGYSANCSDVDPTMRPKLFWRDNPAAGEAPIPEGAFINVTNGCGTSRGLTKDYSLFLPARDTRPPAEVISAQLAGLGAVLNSAQCVRTKTVRNLRRQYDLAVREYERGRPDKAIAALQTLLSIVVSTPQDFASCAENEGGDIRARTSATIYSLQNL